MERYFREARLMKTAPVSQEMMLHYIAERCLVYRGQIERQTIGNP